MTRRCPLLLFLTLLFACRCIGHTASSAELKTRANKKQSTGLSSPSGFYPFLSYSCKSHKPSGLPVGACCYFKKRTPRIPSHSSLCKPLTVLLLSPSLGFPSMLLRILPTAHSFDSMQVLSPPLSLTRSASFLEPTAECSISIPQVTCHSQCTLHSCQIDLMTTRISNLNVEPCSQQGKSRSDSDFQVLSERL